MRVGITGHQRRAGIDWSWVRTQLLRELTRLTADEGLSSLAEGADQVFAECILVLRRKLTAVIPIPNYGQFFSGSAKLNFKKLQKDAEVVRLPPRKSAQLAFFEAGKYIVDNSDVLIAIWDQKPARGIGGTADVVTYATEQNRRILIINPVRRKIERLQW